MFAKFLKGIRDITGYTARQEKKRLAEETKKAEQRQAFFDDAMQELNDTLQEIDDNIASDWNSFWTPEELMDVLGDDLDRFKDNKLTVTDETIERIKQGVKKIFIENEREKFTYAVSVDDYVRIAEFHPSLVTDWREYASSFGLSDDNKEFHTLVDVTPEDVLHVGKLSMSGNVYTGGVMGSRDSFPFAEIGKEDNEIIYYIGCFEGNKEELLKRIDDSYPALEPTMEADEQQPDEERLQEQKYRTDYLAFIKESEEILLPVYDEVPLMEGNTIPVIERPITTLSNSPQLGDG